MTVYWYSILAIRHRDIIMMHFYNTLFYSDAMVRWYHKTMASQCGCTVVSSNNNGDTVMILPVKASQSYITLVW